MLNYSRPEKQATPSKLMTPNYIVDEKGNKLVECLVCTLLSFFVIIQSILITIEKSEFNASEKRAAYVCEHFERSRKPESSIGFGIRNIAQE